MEHFARRRAFNPLLDRLEGTAWDGTARLDTMLVAYFGAEDIPYTREVGRRWMISAVARACKPGCKADHIPVLEAPQGSLKSTACGVLALEPAWFADEVADLGTKDSALDLHGKWVIELGELSAMRRSDIERVKAYVSRQVDHFRPPYGRRSQDHPRRCVFVGTTNADSYLADETGNRRFGLSSAGASTSTRCVATSGSSGPRRSPRTRPASAGGSTPPWNRRPASSRPAA